MSSDPTIRRTTALRPSRTRAAVRVVRSLDPEAPGRLLPLDGRSWTIGRGVSGDGALADPALSRVHFSLRPKGQVDRYVVQDLGGTNGTFVSGAALDGERALEPGDVISAGESLFVMEREPSEADLPAAPGVDGHRARAFLGVSAAADRVRRALETAATTGAPVLLLGPTGAGKEVAAQAIHAASGRKGPLVPVNCAALPQELAEAELFGHKRGAFTGADVDRTGYFVEARGGTLFLDEVGELPAPVQAKLLRVLETGLVQPLGAPSPVKVDVRVVAATLQDVESESSGFRRDLLARLGDWILRLPPLAARRPDILHLFDHVWAEATSAPPPERTLEADTALLLYAWPLNVRELKKLVGRLARLLPEGAHLDLSDLPAPLQEAALGRPEGAAARERQLTTPAARTAAPTAVRQAPRVPIPEREVLEAALARARGNVKQVADEQGWHRMQVYRWMRRYALAPEDFR